MAEKVAKLGLAVGISATEAGPHFRLNIGGEELAGDFLTAPAHDRELAISIEQEAGGDARGASEQTSFKVTVSAGSEKEEHEGLSLKQGRSSLATRVNTASKLIKLEETG
jgi:hypothetical protein